VKFSIVTPSFNQARYIVRTLESVASQEGVTLEHLVRDGGSTDGTVSLLEAFRPAVRWVSEPDGGQADAVNAGIAASDGEIVGWLNSDDVYFPGALQRVARRFALDDRIDVVYGRADHIDADDRVISPYPTRPWDLSKLRADCYLCQPAVFFRRRLVERFGPLDAALRYCMDYEFWLRLGQGGARFDYLEERLAGSRLHEETKTLGSRLPVHEEINDMLKRRFGRVPARWLVHYAHASLEAPGGAGRPGRLAVLAAALRASRRWNGGLPGPEFWREVLPFKAIPPAPGEGRAFPSIPGGRQ
jgi:glycosyltransferase involved in cell wall biosynthesis